jgi:hypothetical protein
MAILSSANLPIEYMQIPIPIVQHATNNIGTITVNPRYNNSTADTKLFDSPGDYAPSAASGGNAYVDITLPMFPHHGTWYNNTHDSSFGRRNGNAGTAIGDIGKVSLWAQLGVGDHPHPGFNYSYTYLAMLTNAAGAHHQFITTGSPTPNYNEPRTIGGGNSLNTFANFRVSGQFYAGGAYGGWYCLANHVNGLFASSDMIRIINLGGSSDDRSRLRIIDLVYIIHGRLGVTGNS